MSRPSTHIANPPRTVEPRPPDAPDAASVNAPKAQSKLAGALASVGVLLGIALLIWEGLRPG